MSKYPTNPTRYPPRPNVVPNQYAKPNSAGAATSTNHPSTPHDAPNAGRVLSTTAPLAQNMTDPNHTVNHAYLSSKSNPAQQSFPTSPHHDPPSQQSSARRDSLQDQALSPPPLSRTTITSDSHPSDPHHRTLESFSLSPCSRRWSSIYAPSHFQFAIRGQSCFPPTTETNSIRQVSILQQATGKKQQPIPFQSILPPNCQTTTKTNYLLRSSAIPLNLLPHPLPSSSLPLSAAASQYQLSSLLPQPPTAQTSAYGSRRTSSNKVYTSQPPKSPNASQYDLPSELLPVQHKPFRNPPTHAHTIQNYPYL